ncbi:MAG TPA: hypothetical protein VF282_05870 [Bacillota bacterium]
MTPDPFSAALDELAACRERITDLETREAGHFAELSGQLSQLAGMVTTVSRALAEDTAALARLDALDRQVGELARGLTSRRENREDRDCRPYAPPWHELAADQRRAAVAELRDWVEHVYRPGYGHLARLGACWAEHDLCLYALDVLSRLWRALYVQLEPGTGLLTARAEYQARILPALAAQLATETTRCAHATPASYPGARR